jgi:GNAT superfamily N-acetyltransferase
MRPLDACSPICRRRRRTSCYEGSISDEHVIRDYAQPDAEHWLRCRAIAFLDTGYFDDVLTKRPQYEGEAVELVAVSRGQLVGLIDVTIEEQTATIETIATHPDHVRRGVATSLLERVVYELQGNVTSLDAWTREDEAANRW